ncbi:MAG: sortase [Candidatus Saccharibacteria bacterium]
MKPDEISSSRGGTPLLPQRSIILTPNPREAATNLIRNSIDNIYNNKADLNETTPDQTTDTGIYNRTQANHLEPQAADWQQYHTAWQTYYQKYYEGFYDQHLKNAKEKLANGEIDKEEKPISEKEAVSKLHQQLIEKVKESTTKVRKSRHFIPLLSGLIVILIFLFLQYNQILISNVLAYVSPGYIDPQNIVINPNANITVGPEPRLIIPKINIDVPVNYDVGNDYDSQMKAMENGVAHFSIPGASSHPGQIGNTVIAGHSSNGLFQKGDYKFIFVQLEKLAKGDTIYANYNSIRYTYSVTRIEIVGPNDVQKLVYETNKPVMTLITCTPIGTDKQRLLVIAEQISPDPLKSTAAPVNTQENEASIPGNSPTFIEWLLGKR